MLMVDRPTLLEIHNTTIEIKGNLKEMNDKLEELNNRTWNIDKLIAVHEERIKTQEIRHSDLVNKMWVIGSGAGLSVLGELFTLFKR